MQVQNALGNYAHAVTAAIVAMILLAWIVVQVGVAFQLVTTTPPMLDTMALAAFTYLLGNVSALNGVKPAIDAANRRLDAVGAPAASVAEKVIASGGTEVVG